MNCLIVDDSAIARSILKNMLPIGDSLTLIAECENAADAYKILAANKIDLLFLDIEMPAMTGIELVKAIGDKRPLIIFVSAKRDYASDAFDLNVVGFYCQTCNTRSIFKSCN